MITYKEAKEALLILTLTLGLVAVFVLCIAAVVGIPAAAIVWIIETLQN